MNNESSRSHTVFSCVIERKWQVDSVMNKRLSCLHLVDLAGSERQKGSGVEGERLKEAVNINKSLSTLGFVTMILGDVANGKQRHVPYRDSKLTFLLQDSLGGNSKTLIIAAVSPSNWCSMETLSTLKFAQRAKHIQNNAVVNDDTSADVFFLQQQVRMLKLEVSRLRLLEDSTYIASETFGAEAEDTQSSAKVITKPCQAKASSCTSENCECIHRMMLKKLKAMESMLRGSLRRERIAEDTEKYLSREIEHLTRLVRQRDDEAQCGRMMLRFREDKIRRLELLTDGVINADKCLIDERNALVEELRLMSTRIDRNPEVTRFAMENIRLLEQLRRLEEYYEQGERDMMLDELSNLRNQFQELLEESNLKDEEIIMMTSQIESYQCDLEKCQSDLNMHIEQNASLARQLEDLQSRNSVLQCESELQKEFEELKVKCSNLLNENECMTNSINQLTRERDREKELVKEWENSTVNLMELLSDGDQAINAATEELEGMIEESPSQCHVSVREKVSFCTANKQTVAELLHMKLKEAYASSRDMEKQMKEFRSLLSYDGEKVPMMFLEYFLPKLQEIKEQIDQEKYEWRKERNQLLVDLNSAKLEAAEKASEAVTVWKKFEACQNVLKDSEFLLNALVKSNETAKGEAKCWKDALCSVTKSQTKAKKIFFDATDDESMSSTEGSISSTEGKEEIFECMTKMHDKQQCHSEEKDLVALHPCMIKAFDKEVSATTNQVNESLLLTASSAMHDISSMVHEMCEQINLLFLDVRCTKSGVESTMDNLEHAWLLLKEEMELHKQNELSKNLHKNLEQPFQFPVNLQIDSGTYHQQARSLDGKRKRGEKLEVQIQHALKENKRKDELLECLESDLALLQECTAEWKDEAEKAKATVKFLQQELDSKTRNMDEIEKKLVDAEFELEKAHKESQGVVKELRQLRGASAMLNTKEDNAEILELKLKCHYLEEELQNKHHAMETIEYELLQLTLHSEKKIAELQESSKQEKDAIKNERDHLKEELLALTERFESSKKLISAQEIVTAEARQAADGSRRHAEEKENEVNLLQGMVLELKRTLYSLESQVLTLKQEAEMQQLLREDCELELQALKHQMSKIHPAIDWNSSDNLHQQTVQNDRERVLERSGTKLSNLQNQIEGLQMKISEKDEQLKNCKSCIRELVAAAELQAHEHQKQIKALNYIVEQIKVDQSRTTLLSSTLSKGAGKLPFKSRRSSSPFNCVKLGVSQQFSFEVEKELFDNRLYIDELQKLALAREKEIFALNVRLAEAESMTQEVLRELLCVKMEITGYASSLSKLTLQRYTDKGSVKTETVKEKAEIGRLKSLLDELITERESWLKDIDCKQRELKTALVASEKLQLRDQRLTKDYERLKGELKREKKLVADLQNMKTGVLSETANSKLPSSATKLEKVSDCESACESSSTSQPDSQDVESNQLQQAENLIHSLCNKILEVAGIASGRDAEPSTAIEVLQQLGSRLQSTEQELAYFKLKSRTAEEKKRLRELRSMQSSLE